MAGAGFDWVGSCWAEHLGPADPWEVPHMNEQHWWLYVTRRDSAARSHDKTGQLYTNTHSSGLPHQAKSPPPPLREKHFQASLTGTIPPHTHLCNTTLLKCRQAGHLCLRPLAVTSGYIKRSSPLSCSGLTPLH